MKRWSLIAVWGFLVLLLIAISVVVPGNASATLISSGSTPYSYATSSGLLEWQGVATTCALGFDPDCSLASPPLSTLGAASEWVYKLTQTAGSDLASFSVHLGNPANAVVLETPNNTEFTASTCTGSPNCTSGGWTITLSAFGTVTWTDLSGYTSTAPIFFELYSPDTGRGTVPCEIGDGGSTTVNCGAPMPEPSTLFLLGSGLAGLGLWGWKRRSRAQA